MSLPENGNWVVTVRFRVIFRGNVQGVGFRYTVLESSHSFDVEGLVKNLPDGTVLLVCEGQRPILKSFLDTILQRRSANIREHRLEELSATGEYTGFRIRG